jgi:hypothetical protein
LLRELAAGGEVKGDTTTLEDLVLQTTTCWRSRRSCRITEEKAMLDTEQINDLHRLYWSEHWSHPQNRAPSQNGLAHDPEYLDAPAQGPPVRSRSSKLDSFKGNIAEWLEKDPQVTAAVIEQRLRPLGYDGGSSILQEYVRKVRPQLKPRRAFVRMEPIAGERFEVDWGHFGALDYSGDSRKLYAFALVDAHSRMMYVEFTHCQSFETLIRCHVHAFTELGGVARQIAYDNLATAVAEHDGRIVRFRRASSRLREYGFFRTPAIPQAAGKKGKSNEPSVTCARTSGLCASSPICTT